MDKNTLITPATLDGVNLLKDGSVSLRFSTQEIKPEDLAVIKHFHNKFGQLGFSENELQPTDISQKDAEFEGKTPSQRLRNVIMVLHSQLRKQNKTSLSSEEFYRGQVENLIDQYKSKLEPNL